MVATVVWGAVALNGEDMTHPYDAPPRDPFPSQEITHRPILIYFPPEPPPLVDVLQFASLHLDPETSRHLQERAQRRRAGLTVAFDTQHLWDRSGRPPPRAAEPYLAEPFYAPLASLLGERLLPQEQQALVHEFTQLRDVLLTQLRQVIHAHAVANPSARREALERLAAGQAGDLARLEELAERLRKRLAHGEFPARQVNVDWEALREWRLGRGALKHGREQHLAIEHEVMRAAAFYFEGLSPGQRRLLREIAVELESRAFRAADQASSGRWIFFSPAGARILTPEGISPELAARFAAFREASAALKRGLQDGLYQADGRGEGSRTRALRRLADEQRASFAELEAMADEIRRALVAEGWPRRHALPPAIPAELEKRMVALLPPNRRSPRAIMQGRADPSRRIFIGVDGSAIELPDPQNSLRMPSDDYERQLLACRQALVELAGEGAALESGHAPHERIRTLLREHRTATLLFEYEMAVFEPGLSPEQRRLLFAGVQHDLWLFPPGGELQPTKLPGTLVR